MPRKIPKWKLVLDENFLSRAKLPRLNHRFNLKHIKEDLRYIGIPDEKVYEIAVKQQRLIVTFNDKDFIGMATKNDETGIIGVSANLNNEQIDKKLLALLLRKTKRQLYGAFTYISGETDTGSVTG